MISPPEGKRKPIYSTDVVKSLPLWYQALAQVLQEKGDLIISDKAEGSL